MSLPQKYHGIGFMLLAAACFSMMGGAAKLLRQDFNAGQLVFFRNSVGLVMLVTSLLARPPQKIHGPWHWLLFRGVMGTVALYTLLYCIMHLPLGTAMTYNLTSALFITVFSFFLFQEYNGPRVLFAVLLGFTGMLMVYKPAMHFAWYYHLAGLISGVSSAFAYMTVGRLNRYFDARLIVGAFVVCGVLIPLGGMGLHYGLGLHPDEVFVLDFHWPQGRQWGLILFLGAIAFMGQYFVTRAYGADRAGIVSAVGYANIVFSVFIGMGLGDRFPDLLSLAGIAFIICSGVIISLVKKNSPVPGPSQG